MRAVHEVVCEDRRVALGAPRPDHAQIGRVEPAQQPYRRPRPPPPYKLGVVVDAVEVVGAVLPRMHMASAHERA